MTNITKKNQAISNLFIRLKSQKSFLINLNMTYRNEVFEYKNYKRTNLMIYV